MTGCCRLEGPAPLFADVPYRGMPQYSLMQDTSLAKVPTQSVGLKARI